MKPRYILIVGCLVLLLPAGIVGMKYLSSFYFPHASKIIPPFREVSRGVGRYLISELYAFYLESDIKDSGDRYRGFVDYLTQTGSSIMSDMPPDPSYASSEDICFHLWLPAKLESTSPTIIAYTNGFRDSIADVESTIYRGVIILCGGTAFYLVIPEGTVQELFGGTFPDDDWPVLYSWPKKLQYDTIHQSN